MPQLQKVLAGPRCEQCGGTTRVLEIEQHKRRKWAHVWTLECTVCRTPDKIERQIPPHQH